MTIVESTSGFGVEALQPAFPPIVVSFKGTDNLTALVGQQVTEVNLIKDLDRESFIRLYPPLAYYELDKVATPVDTLYRETQAPVYKTPVAIPIFITLEPPKRLLKRYGLEAEQEAIGLVSAGWLERHDPTLQMKTGDRIAYYDQPYTGSFPNPSGLPDTTVTHEATARVPNFMFEVLTAKWCDYFTNTQIPLHKILTLKNLRAPGIQDTNVNPR
jgi:hypothetical protein